MSVSREGSDQAGLVDLVADWLCARDELTDEAKLVVLAALEGDDALLAALNGLDSRLAGREPSRAVETAEVQPAGAFLKTISVRGFRGIGPEARLRIRPGPGLTIVTGRNGSGKSSFSDALEVALTGNTYRWRNKKTKLWSEHWRNVHDGAHCGIRVELAEEGVGITTVGVDWADGAALVDQKVWVQRPGERQEPGVSSLGWDRAIELYQPVLSYDELGGVLDQGPSTLFDKIDAILGIEQVTDAEKRVSTSLKELREADKAAKLQVRELKKVLAGLTDERAARASEQLRKRSPDLDAVEAIATGTARAPVDEPARLKALTQVVPPSRTDVAAAAQALRDAAKAHADASVVSIDIADRRARLLREALAFHEHHGDGQCPVCGQGALDAAWRAKVTTELGAEDEDLARYRAASRRLTQARENVRTLLNTTPSPAQPGRFVLDSLVEAQQARARWLTAPDGDDQLADHLEAAYDDLEAAFGLVRQEAEAVLIQHEDEWAPHASALAAWVGLARKAREAEPHVLLVESAHEFLKQAVERLRNQELTRLTDAARDIWAELKQESNVNLGAIELKGSNTRRRLELRADVDGAEAQAIGVMSQGELHALAMALFLPRATMPGSPFRFVVLDDPIQAMDPAKVEGFVRVLARLAEERQVVVFSHDDRLPQVVRQTGVRAEIFEVFRQAGSSVEVVTCLDPVRRYLADAFAITRDEVPQAVAARIVPGLCRMATEAALHDIYFNRRLSAGDRRADVEKAWQETVKTGHRLALVLHGDKRADLTTWLAARPWRKRALGIVTRGPHTGVDGDLKDAVRDVERLVDDIRAVA